jgi:hypothetical protein
MQVLAHSTIEYPQVSDFGMAVAPNVEMFLNVRAEVNKAALELKTVDLVFSKR